MTERDKVDFEELMKPYWRQLFFGLLTLIGVALFGAFFVGQMVNRAEAALSSLQAQVNEMQAVKNEMIVMLRRMDGIEAQMRVHGNDLQWIKEALKTGGR